MAPNREEVLLLVRETVKDILASTRIDAPTDVSDDERLIGHNALFDSMGLVTLVVEIEQRLESEHDVVVLLADERAMSQTKSPFRSITSLVDYIMQVAETELA